MCLFRMWKIFRFHSMLYRRSTSALNSIGPIKNITCELYNITLLTDQKTNVQRDYPN